MEQLPVIGIRRHFWGKSVGVETPQTLISTATTEVDLPLISKTKHSEVKSAGVSESILLAS
jgi:hypothetical protein